MHDTYQSPDDYASPQIHHDPEPASRQLGRPPAELTARAAVAAATGEAAAENDRQAAFDSAFEWHGVALLPWSSSRDSLFHQHRLAMGAPSFESCLDDVDAFAADAARILWLCSHLPKDWAVLRANPAEFQAVIDTWADVHVPTAESLQASVLAVKIHSTARRNQHEAAPAAGKGHGDDLGN